MMRRETKVTFVDTFVRKFCLLVSSADESRNGCRLVHLSNLNQERYQGMIIKSADAARQLESQCSHLA
jgi:hypothetical protein